jgi:hypothetical protein
MKARASRAVSCGHWVTVGQTIVKVPGAGGWVCLACRLAEPPAPARGQREEAG